MAMLFWLEFLYGLDAKTREDHEAKFKAGKLKGFSGLRGLMPKDKRGFASAEYGSLKQQVAPFMLPFAESRTAAETV